jgi:hypothetical protein
MRYWIYVEPCTLLSSEPVYHIMSDEAVIAVYWDYWREKMTRAGLEQLLDTERCITDWATVNWAQEVTLQVLSQFVTEPGQP